MGMHLTPCERGKIGTMDHALSSLWVQMCALETILCLQPGPLAGLKASVWLLCTLWEDPGPPPQTALRVLCSACREKQCMASCLPPNLQPRSLCTCCFLLLLTGFCSPFDVGCDLRPCKPSRWIQALLIAQLALAVLYYALWLALCYRCK